MAQVARCPRGSQLPASRPPVLPALGGLRKGQAFSSTLSLQLQASPPGLYLAPLQVSAFLLGMRTQDPPQNLRAPCDMERWAPAQDCGARLPTAAPQSTAPWLHPQRLRPLLQLMRSETGPKRDLGRPRLRHQPQGACGYLAPLRCYTAHLGPGTPTATSPLPTHSANATRASSRLGDASWSGTREGSRPGAGRGGQVGGGRAPQGREQATENSSWRRGEDASPGSEPSDTHSMVPSPLTYKNLNTNSKVKLLRISRRWL